LRNQSDVGRNKLRAVPAEQIFHVIRCRNGAVLVPAYEHCKTELHDNGLKSVLRITQSMYVKAVLGKMLSGQIDQMTMVREQDHLRVCRWH
jgi:hypothetical protein